MSVLTSVTSREFCVKLMTPHYAHLGFHSENFGKNSMESPQRGGKCTWGRKSLQLSTNDLLVYVSKQYNIDA